MNTGGNFTIIFDFSQFPFQFGRLKVYFVGSAQISNGRFYCTIRTDIADAGIFSVGLDGSAPRRLTSQTTPGMPLDCITEIVVTGDKIFGLTSLESVSYVHWYDPATTEWQIIASSRRAEKKTILDSAERYLLTPVYDAPRHRVLFSPIQSGFPPNCKTGLHAFDTISQQITLLKPFPSGGVMDMQQMDADRIWVSFCGPADTLQSTYEYSMASNTWSLVYELTEQKWGSDVPGADRTHKQFLGKQNIWPPFAVIDGWLWSFYPFGRTTLDGKIREEFPVLEPRAAASYDDSGFWRENTLQFIPELHAVLYGDCHSIWLLELPDSAGASQNAKSP